MPTDPLPLVISATVDNAYNVTLTGSMGVADPGDYMVAWQVGMGPLRPFVACLAALPTTVESTDLSITIYEVWSTIYGDPVTIYGQGDPDTLAGTSFALSGSPLTFPLTFPSTVTSTFQIPLGLDLAGEWVQLIVLKSPALDPTDTWFSAWHLLPDTEEWNHAGGALPLPTGSIMFQSRINDIIPVFVIDPATGEAIERLLQPMQLFSLDYHLATTQLWNLVRTGRMYAYNARGPVLPPA